MFDYLDIFVDSFDFGIFEENELNELYVYVGDVDLIRIIIE